MKTFIGIDLGSTTTKSVLIDENSEVIGRGITNSRSNYATAARVASEEARVDAQFTLFRRALSESGKLGDRLDQFLGALERAFRLEQFLVQLEDLERTCLGQIGGERFAGVEAGIREAIAEVFRRLREEAPALFAPGARRKSDFFRDIAGSSYHNHAEEVARVAGLAYELLLNVYDKSIIDVENRPPAGALERQVPARAVARAGVRGFARFRLFRYPGDHRTFARHRVGGDLSRRHRLRTGDAAVLEGAHPLGDSVSWAGCTHDVSARRGPFWTSAAKIPRVSRSTPTASWKISR